MEGGGGGGGERGHYLGREKIVIFPCSARGGSVLERRGRGRSPTAAAGFEPTSLYPKKILVIMAMALLVITPRLLAPAAIPPSRRRLVLARRLQLPRASRQAHFGIILQALPKPFLGQRAPPTPTHLLAAPPSGIEQNAPINP